MHGTGKQGRKTGGKRDATLTGLPHIKQSKNTTPALDTVVPLDVTVPNPLRSIPLDEENPSGVDERDFCNIEDVGPPEPPLPLAMELAV